MCKICRNSQSWLTEICQSNHFRAQISWSEASCCTLQIHWTKHRVRFLQNNIRLMRKSKALPMEAALMVLLLAALGLLKVATATTTILPFRSFHVMRSWKNSLKLIRSSNALKLIKNALNREFWRTTTSKMDKRIRKKARREKALQIKIYWLWQTMTVTPETSGKAPRPVNRRIWLLTASQATDKASQWKATPATRANWAYKRQIPLSVRHWYAKMKWPKVYTTRITRVHINQFQKTKWNMKYSTARKASCHPKSPTILCTTCPSTYMTRSDPKQALFSKSTHTQSFL